MRKVAITLFLCALFSNASAAIIDNGTFTTDTATGLDWLDVTATNGESYNYVTGTRLTGDLVGWRYATGAELTTLLTNWYGFGPNAADFNGAAAWSFEGELALQETIITTLGDTTGVGATLGILSDPASASEVYVGMIRDIGAEADYTQVHAAQIDTTPVSGWGSFLVRDPAAIPEPPHYAALLTAFGLIAYRRYKYRT